MNGNFVRACRFTRTPAVLATILSVASAFALETPPEIFRPGDFVLFQGDSITHGGRGRDFNHYLGHGYQAEIAMRCMAAYPTNDIRAATGRTANEPTTRSPTPS